MTDVTVDFRPTVPYRFGEEFYPQKGLIRGEGRDLSD